MLVFVLTVDAKRHHRSCEAVVLHKKSIFGRGNMEKPHSLKQKLVKTAAKHALKTGRKKFAHKSEIKRFLHTLALFLDISLTPLSLSIYTSIISTWQRYFYLIHLKISRSHRKMAWKWIWTSIQYWTSISTNCSEFTLISIWWCLLIFKLLLYLKVYLRTSNRQAFIRIPINSTPHGLHVTISKFFRSFVLLNMDE
ncbi:hypothetical protein EGR_08593 [Echinococcus granulosus]|uniref:Uncharacterized protein n=1 Tax=Echinococcus granulosus TaxID=6210 RepID=W6UEP8_ECHGR|nr:hypothetical protein EGR_08593 [Echinococcus granulosus]EUB56567.1 hypothetical protein EGR_08593 [Echinococcus granulosus]